MAEPRGVRRSVGTKHTHQAPLAARRQPRLQIRRPTPCTCIAVTSRTRTRRSRSPRTSSALRRRRQMPNPSCRNKSNSCRSGLYTRSERTRCHRSCSPAHAPSRHQGRGREPAQARRMRARTRHGTQAIGRWARPTAYCLRYPLGRAGGEAEYFCEDEPYDPREAFILRHHDDCVDVAYKDYDPFSDNGPA